MRAWIKNNVRILNFSLIILLLGLHFFIINFTDLLNNFIKITFNILAFGILLFVFFETRYVVKLRNRLKLLEFLNASVFDKCTVFDAQGKSIYDSSGCGESLSTCLEQLDKNFQTYGTRPNLLQDIRLEKSSDGFLQQHQTGSIYYCEFSNCFDFRYALLLLKNVSNSLQYFLNLEKDHAQLEKFVERSAFGLIYTDQQHMITGSNKTVEKYLGCSMQNFMHKPIDQLFDFRATQDQETAIITTAEGKKLFIFFSQFSHAVGIYFVLPSAPVYAVDNILSCGLPYVIIDVEGSIVSFNDAFGHLFPHTPVKNNDNFYVLVHKSLRSEIKSKYTRVAENNQDVPPYECRFEGQDIYTTTYTSRIKDDHLFFLQFIDISERKCLEQQFIQSQKMQAVGQLAGGIAHDFNNVLTAIIGFCDLLLQRYMPNDPSYTDLIQIKQNANRAANLVRQLLAFSRQQNLQPRVVCVTEALAELSSLLHRLLGSHIQLDIHHGKDLWPIKVDVSQFEQVIINLAVNARDAMGEQGILTIRTMNFTATANARIGHDVMVAGKYVKVEIEDNGSGIAAENLDHIFEPFFSTKNLGSGTGLGLSTVYGIVKQTGGFIDVATQVDKGSTFTIYIPCFQEDGSASASIINLKKQEIFEDLTGKESILFVEDEDAVRIFAARALREKGYDVTEAISGKQALAFCDKGQCFDLIITDLVMPEMDGLDFSKQMQARYPHTPIIFISGYSEDSIRHNLNEGNLHFLAKPFNIKGLASKVKEVLNTVRII